MRPLLIALALAASVATAAAQRPAGDTSLTVDRIFRDGAFRSERPPTIHWLKDGRSYLATRDNARGGTDIIRVDLERGTERIIAPAARLVTGEGRRIDVEEISLSHDESKALLFSGSVRVWRANTRGVYHVLDFATGRITPVAPAADAGPATPPAPDTMQSPALGRRKTDPAFLAEPVQSGLQMFAKFSPDGRQVAFVADNDLYLTDIATGSTRALTMDGDTNIINGTTDWVYEEELGLRDAFRWSPDSRRIAFWRFDQSAVPAFPMVDELTLYPTVSVLRYPKAGQPNSRVRIGVMDVATARTTWMDTGPDTGVYLARAEWLGGDSLVIQRLPRRQNRLEALVASAATGKARSLFVDSDSAYVDVEDIVWLGGDRQFLWLSDRSGWRQLYLHDRSGRVVRQLTTDGMDVLSVSGVNEARGEVYVVAAAPTPTQRQVFAVPLRGGAMRRITQQPGSHSLSVGPGGRYAVGVHSSAVSPPTATLYQLPAFTPRRVLTDNAALRAKVAALGMAPRFFRVPMPDGTQLDAMRIVPANFDSTRKHPVLMFVYGGPASPSVNDAFGGNRMLWHMLLAQRGYVVVTVDNRGAAWRGRAFRKVTQLALGRHEARDQIDAARWIGRQPWGDSTRIGMYGWSYGGYLTALTTAIGGDLFRVGIVGAPVIDWRLYDTIYTERFMWTPQQNAAGYRESSPLTHVGTLRARLLLAHGTGDDNVHPQNTIQFADRLVAAGKPFTMLLYPNRTHSITGAASAHLYEAFTHFLLQNL